MEKETYKGKQVIWKSRWSRIMLTLVSFLFVGIAIFLGDASREPFYFWGTMILFGGGGLLQLFQLLNPRNLFVSVRSPLGKQIIKEQYEARVTAPGEYIYTSDGFTIPSEQGPLTYQWTDIETIFGFKRDLMTIDEIYMDIFFANGTSLRFSEEMSGWHQFNERLLYTIPEVPNDWEVNIASPAFATNLTLLYDKAGRTQEAAIAASYKS